MLVIIIMTMQLLTACDKDEDVNPLYKEDVPFYFTYEYVDMNAKLREQLPEYDFSLNMFSTNKFVECGNSVYAIDEYNNNNAGILFFDSIAYKFSYKELFMVSSEDNKTISPLTGLYIQDFHVNNDYSIDCIFTYRIYSEIRDPEELLQFSKSTGRSINESKSSKYYYAHFDSDGVMTLQKLIYDIDENIGSADISSYNIYISNSGLTYIIGEPNSDPYVCVLDNEDNVIQFFRLLDILTKEKIGNLRYNKMFANTDGEPCALFLDNVNERQQYYKICDLLNESLPEPVILSCDVGGTIAYLSDDEVYYSTRYGVYCEKPGVSEHEDILNWVDVDFTTDVFNSAFVESRDRIIAPYADQYAFAPYFVIIERCEPYYFEGKTITVAYEEFSSYSEYKTNGIGNFLALAVRFNHENKDYRIRMIPYVTDDVSSACDKLYRDIVSGNIPDIILYGATITPEPFLKTKSFKNLYSLMDDDDEYKRSAFLPCVTKTVETADGELPYLILNFDINTLSGVSKNLKKKNSWSVDDLESAMNSLGQGQYLIKMDSCDNPQFELFKKLLPSVVEQYIDYEKQTCDFDDSFKKLVELCRTAPIMSVDGSLDPTRYIDGDVLLTELKFSTYAAYLTDRTRRFALEEISMLGAPRNDNAKYSAAVVPDMSVSITKRSPNIDGAWEFIKYYLDCGVMQWETFKDQPQIDYMAEGISPTWKTAEMMFDVMDDNAIYIKFNPTVLTNGEDGITVEREIVKRPPDKDPADNKKATQEERNRWASYKGFESRGYICSALKKSEEKFLRDFFKHGTVIESGDTAVISIVTEEISAYYAGIQSLDDAVRLIENRVTTRIQE